MQKHLCGPGQRIRELPGLSTIQNPQLEGRTGLGGRTPQLFLQRAKRGAVPEREAQDDPFDTNPADNRGHLGGPGTGGSILRYEDSSQAGFLFHAWGAEKENAVRRARVDNIR